MGVNFGRLGTVILNKGAQLVCTADLQITSPGGGGGGDVTPNPTPDWGGYYIGVPANSSTIQIQGINTPITLSMNLISSDGGTLTVGVNATNTYGGTITTYTTEPTNFTVNLNEYVTFRWVGGGIGYAISFDVYNVSDGNTRLGTNVILVYDTP